MIFFIVQNGFGCLEYLALIKCQDECKCYECNHTKFTVRKSSFGMDCNLCHQMESPRANALLHKVKLGFRKKKNSF